MKKIITNLLIILVVIQLFVLLLAAAPIEKDCKYDLTSVETDLQGATIGGKLFNMSDYSINPNDKIRPIYFSEFCFSYDLNLFDDYALYVYVYNPQNKHIQINSLKNKITIATKYNDKDPVVYTKFSLKFCSRTKNNMIYKFKIIDNDNIILNTTLKNLETFKGRQYDISGLEIVEFGENKAIEYLYGMSCLYSGYGKGYGEDKNNNTLKIQVKDLQTLKLKVSPTNYLTNSSSTGPYHRNNISSVYFSVPNEILNQYGYLDSINAEWDEYQTQPIVVTSNSNFYDEMKKQVNYNLHDEKTRTLMRLYYGASTMQGPSGQIILPGGSIVPGKGPDVKWGYDWAYGINNNSGEKLDGGHFEVSVDSNSYQLPYVFYSEKMDDKSIFEELNYQTVAGEVNKNELLDYIYSYQNKGNFIDGDSIENELFTESLDLVRNQNTNIKRGYNNITAFLEDSYNLNSYNSNHSWIDKLIDYGFTQPDGLDEGDLQVDAIRKITDEDLSGSISDKLLVNSLDEDEFKQYCYNSFMSEETPYLFRFAVSDYFSRAIGRFSNIEGVNDCDEEHSDSYISQQTVFLNFDIISLRFAKEAEYTVIPVISNPIDIATSVVPPQIEYSIIDLGIGHIKESFRGLGSKFVEFWDKSKNILMPIGITICIILIFIVVMTITSAVMKKRKQQQEVKIVVSTENLNKEVGEKDNNSDIDKS